MTQRHAETGGLEMTLEQLAKRTAECKEMGYDVRALPSSAVYDAAIPKDVRDVLRLDLVRRWSDRRAVELLAAG
jgi:hypothetical protein